MRSQRCAGWIAALLVLLTLGGVTGCGNDSPAAPVDPSPSPEEDVVVPKVVGEDVEKATSELQDLGLEPKVQESGVVDAPTDVVLEQHPAAGQRVQRGTTVVLITAMP